MGTLGGKKHFELLDGLRGIAAITVVVFHFMEMYILKYENNFIGHGFLAVDFFFCLSGFVIAYSYDDRISNMSLKTFFKSRLIRLHPLVVIGSLMGLLSLILDPFLYEGASYSPWEICLMFIMSILVIPFPVMKERTYNLFSLNAPSWSLFWEYVANILYAFVLCRLPKKVLVFVAVVFGVLLCYVVATTGDIMGGWGKQTFWHGGVRLGFSFSVGMLLYRYQLKIKNSLSFVSIALLLAISFVLPYGKSNVWLEPLIVIVYFPLIIMLGVGNEQKGLSNSNKFSRFLGNVSYPLYMTHYTFIWIFYHYISIVKPSQQTVIFVICIGVTCMLLIAYLVEKYIDTPIRGYLKKKYLGKR